MLFNGAITNVATVALLARGLGHIPLAKLTPDEVQTFLNRKLASGLSPRRVQYMHAVCAVDADLHPTVLQPGIAQAVLETKRHQVLERSLRFDAANQHLDAKIESASRRR